jgi:hypothetical protein
MSEPGNDRPERVSPLGQRPVVEGEIQTVIRTLATNHIFYDLISNIK